MWHKAREDPLPHVQPTHSAALDQFASEAERQGVDFLFIDTAPQSDKPAINAAEAADIILIICKPSVMDLRAIQNTIRLTKLADLKPGAKVLTVLTQIEPFGKLHEEATKTLKRLGVDVLPQGLGRRVAYHHGLINGQTALEYEPGGKGAQEVRDLYAKILSSCLHAIKPSRRRGGRPMRAKRSELNLESLGAAAGETRNPVDVLEDQREGTPKSRAGKKQIQGFFPPAYRQTIKILAAREGRTVEMLLQEAMHDLFVKHQIDLNM